MARPDVCLAAESATASIVVAAHSGSSTSLKVSVEWLQFDVTTADQSAVAMRRSLRRRFVDHPEFFTAQLLRGRRGSRRCLALR